MTTTRTRKHYSDQDKINLVGMVLYGVSKGATHQDVCNALEVSPSCIYRWESQIVSKELRGKFELSTGNKRRVTLSLQRYHAKHGKGTYTAGRPARMTPAPKKEKKPEAVNLIYHEVEALQKEDGTTVVNSTVTVPPSKTAPPTTFPMVKSEVVNFCASLDENVRMLEEALRIFKENTELQKRAQWQMYWNSHGRTSN